MSYARGDVPVTRVVGNQSNKILARTPFKAVPMTIDFTSVQADADGKYKVPAGTPVDNAGAPMTAFKVNTGTSESPSYKYAQGCLLYDVYKDEPAGAVLKDAFIDCGLAKASTTLLLTHPMWLMHLRQTPKLATLSNLRMYRLDKEV